MDGDMLWGQNKKKRIFLTKIYIKYVKKTISRWLKSKNYRDKKIYFDLLSFSTVYLCIYLFIYLKMASCGGSRRAVQCDVDR